MKGMGHMNKRKYLLALIMLVFVCLLPLQGVAAEKEKEKQKNDFKIPSHVLSIAKENTFPNSTEDQEVVEPSKLTKILLDEVDRKSTRLNSSHVATSYAVFCLKKKKKK